MKRFQSRSSKIPHPILQVKKAEDKMFTGELDNPPAPHKQKPPSDRPAVPCDLEDDRLPKAKHKSLQPGGQKAVTKWSPGLVDSCSLDVNIQQKPNKNRAEKKRTSHLRPKILTQPIKSQETSVTAPCKSQEAPITVPDMVVRRKVRRIPVLSRRPEDFPPRTQRTTERFCCDAHPSHWSRTVTTCVWKTPSSLPGEDIQPRYMTHRYSPHICSSDSSHYAKLQLPKPRSYFNTEAVDKTFSSHALVEQCLRDNQGKALVTAFLSSLAEMEGHEEGLRRKASVKDLVSPNNTSPRLCDSRAVSEQPAPLLSSESSSSSLTSNTDVTISSTVSGSDSTAHSTDSLSSKERKSDVSHEEKSLKLLKSDCGNGLVCGMCPSFTVPDNLQMTNGIQQQSQLKLNKSYTEAGDLFGKHDSSQVSHQWDEECLEVNFCKQRRKSEETKAESIQIHAASQNSRPSVPEQPQQQKKCIDDESSQIFNQLKSKINFSPDLVDVQESKESQLLSMGDYVDIPKYTSNHLQLFSNDKTCDLQPGDNTFTGKETESLHNATNSVSLSIQDPCTENSEVPMMEGAKSIQPSEILITSETNNRQHLSFEVGEQLPSADIDVLTITEKNPINTPDNYTLPEVIHRQCFSLQDGDRLSSETEKVTSTTEVKPIIKTPDPFYPSEMFNLVHLSVQENSQQVLSSAEEQATTKRKAFVDELSDYVDPHHPLGNDSEAVQCALDEVSGDKDISTVASSTHSGLCEQPNLLCLSSVGYEQSCSSGKILTQEPKASMTSPHDQSVQVNLKMSSTNLQDSSVNVNSFVRVRNFVDESPLKRVKDEVKKLNAAYSQTSICNQASWQKSRCNKHFHSRFLNLHKICMQNKKSDISKEEAASSLKLCNNENEIHGAHREEDERTNSWSKKTIPVVYNLESEIHPPARVQTLTSTANSDYKHSLASKCYSVIDRSRGRASSGLNSPAGSFHTTNADSSLYAVTTPTDTCKSVSNQLLNEVFEGVYAALPYFPALTCFSDSELERMRAFTEGELENLPSSLSMPQCLSNETQSLKRWAFPSEGPNFMKTKLNDSDGNKSDRAAHVSHRSAHGMLSASNQFATETTGAFVGTELDLSTSDCSQMACPTNSCFFVFDVERDNNLSPGGSGSADYVPQRRTTIGGLQVVVVQNDTLKTQTSCGQGKDMARPRAALNSSSHQSSNDQVCSSSAQFSAMRAVTPGDRKTYSSAGYAVTPLANDKVEAVSADYDCARRDDESASLSSNTIASSARFSNHSEHLAEISQSPVDAQQMSTHGDEWTRDRHSDKHDIKMESKLEEKIHKTWMTSRASLLSPGDFIYDSGSCSTSGDPTHSSHLAAERLDLSDMWTGRMSQSSEKVSIYTNEASRAFESGGERNTDLKSLVHAEETNSLCSTSSTQSCLQKTCGDMDISETQINKFETVLPIKNLVQTTSDAEIANEFITLLALDKVIADAERSFQKLFQKSERNMSGRKASPELHSSSILKIDEDRQRNVFCKTEERSSSESTFFSLETIKEDSMKLLDLNEQQNVSHVSSVSDEYLAGQKSSIFSQTSTSQSKVSLSDESMEEISSVILRASRQLHALKVFLHDRRLGGMFTSLVVEMCDALTPASSQDSSKAEAQRLSPVRDTFQESQTNKDGGLQLHSLSACDSSYTEVDETRPIDSTLGCVSKDELDLKAKDINRGTGLQFQNSFKKNSCDEPAQKKYDLSSTLRESHEFSSLRREQCQMGNASILSQKLNAMKRKSSLKNTLCVGESLSSAPWTSASFNGHFQSGVSLTELSESRSLTNGQQELDNIETDDTSSSSWLSGSTAISVNKEEALKIIESYNTIGSFIRETLEETDRNLQILWNRVHEREHSLYIDQEVQRHPQASSAQNLQNCVGSRVTETASCLSSYASVCHEKAKCLSPQQSKKIFEGSLHTTQDGENFSMTESATRANVLDNKFNAEMRNIRWKVNRMLNLIQGYTPSSSEENQDAKTSRKDALTSRKSALYSASGDTKSNLKELNKKETTKEIHLADEDQERESRQNISDIFQRYFARESLIPDRFMPISLLECDVSEDAARQGYMPASTFRVQHSQPSIQRSSVQIAVWPKLNFMIKMSQEETISLTNDRIRFIIWKWRKWIQMKNSMRSREHHTSRERHAAPCMTSTEDSCSPLSVTLAPEDNTAAPKDNRAASKKNQGKRRSSSLHAPSDETMHTKQESRPSVKTKQEKSHRRPSAEIKHMKGKERLLTNAKDPQNDGTHSRNAEDMAKKYSNPANLKASQHLEMDPKNVLGEKKVQALSSYHLLGDSAKVILTTSEHADHSRKAKTPARKDGTPSHPSSRSGNRASSRTLDRTAQDQVVFQKANPHTGSFDPYHSSGTRQHDDWMIDDLTRHPLNSNIQLINRHSATQLPHKRETDSALFQPKQRITEDNTKSPKRRKLLKDTVSEGAYRTKQYVDRYYGDLHNQTLQPSGSSNTTVIRRAQGPDNVSGNVYTHSMMKKKIPCRDSQLLYLSTGSTGLFSKNVQFMQTDPLKGRHMRVSCQPPTNFQHTEGPGLFKQMLQKIRTWFQSSPSVPSVDFQGRGQTSSTGTEHSSCPEFLNKDAAFSGETGMWRKSVPRGLLQPQQKRHPRTHLFLPLRSSPPCSIALHTEASDSASSTAPSHFQHIYARSASALAPLRKSASDAAPSQKPLYRPKKRKDPYPVQSQGSLESTGFQPPTISSNAAHQCFNQSASNTGNLENQEMCNTEPKLSSTAELNLRDETSPLTPEGSLGHVSRSRSSNGLDSPPIMQGIHYISRNSNNVSPSTSISLQEPMDKWKWDVARDSKSGCDTNDLFPCSSFSEEAFGKEVLMNKFLQECTHWQKDNMNQTGPPDMSAKNSKAVLNLDSVSHKAKDHLTEATSRMKDEHCVASSRNQPKAPNTRQSQSSSPKHLEHVGAETMKKSKNEESKIGQVNSSLPETRAGIFQSHFVPNEKPCTLSKSQKTQNTFVLWNKRLTSTGQTSTFCCLGDVSGEGAKEFYSFPEQLPHGAIKDEVFFKQYQPDRRRHASDDLSVTSSAHRKSDIQMECSGIQSSRKSSPLSSFKSMKSAETLRSCIFETSAAKVSENPETSQPKDKTHKNKSTFTSKTETGSSTEEGSSGNVNDNTPVYYECQPDSEIFLSPRLPAKGKNDGGKKQMVPQLDEPSAVYLSMCATGHSVFKMTGGGGYSNCVKGVDLSKSSKEKFECVEHEKARRHLLSGCDSIHTQTLDQEFSPTSGYSSHTSSPLSDPHDAAMANYHAVRQQAAKPFHRHLLKLPGQFPTMCPSFTKTTKDKFQNAHSEVSAFTPLSRYRKKTLILLSGINSPERKNATALPGCSCLNENLKDNKTRNTNRAAAKVSGECLSHWEIQNAAGSSLFSTEKENLTRGKHEETRTSRNEVRSVAQTGGLEDEIADLDSDSDCSQLVSRSRKSDSSSPQRPANEEMNVAQKIAFFNQLIDSQSKVRPRVLIRNQLLVNDTSQKVTKANHNMFLSYPHSVLHCETFDKSGRSRTTSVLSLDTEQKYEPVDTGQTEETDTDEELQSVSVNNIENTALLADQEAKQSSLEHKHLYSSKLDVTIFKKHLLSVKNASVVSESGDDTLQLSPPSENNNDPPFPGSLTDARSSESPVSLYVSPPILPSSNSRKGFGDERPGSVYRADQEVQASRASQIIAASKLCNFWTVILPGCSNDNDDHLLRPYPSSSIHPSSGNVDNNQQAYRTCAAPAAKIQNAQLVDNRCIYVKDSALRHNPDSKNERLRKWLQNDNAQLATCSPRETSVKHQANTEGASKNDITCYFSRRKTSNKAVLTPCCGESREKGRHGVPSEYRNMYCSLKCTSMLRGAGDEAISTEHPESSSTVQSQFETMDALPQYKPVSHNSDTFSTYSARRHISDKDFNQSMNEVIESRSLNIDSDSKSSSPPAFLIERRDDAVSQKHLRKKQTVVITKHERLNRNFGNIYVCSEKNSTVHDSSSRRMSTNTPEIHSRVDSRRHHLPSSNDQIKCTKEITRSISKNPSSTENSPKNDNPRNNGTNSFSSNHHQFPIRPLGRTISQNLHHEGQSRPSLHRTPDHIVSQSGQWQVDLSLRETCDQHLYEYSVQPSGNLHGQVEAIAHTYTAVKQIQGNNAKFSGDSDLPYTTTLRSSLCHVYQEESRDTDSSSELSFTSGRAKSKGSPLWNDSSEEKNRNKCCHSSSSSDIISDDDSNSSKSARTAYSTCLSCDSFESHSTFFSIDNNSSDGLKGRTISKEGQCIMRQYVAALTDQTNRLIAAQGTSALEYDLKEKLRRTIQEYFRKFVLLCSTTPEMKTPILERQISRESKQFLDLCIQRAAQKCIKEIADQAHKITMSERMARGSEGKDLASHRSQNCRFSANPSHQDRTMFSEQSDPALKKIIQRISCQYVKEIIDKVRREGKTHSDGNGLKLQATPNFWTDGNPNPPETMVMSKSGHKVQKHSHRLAPLCMTDQVNDTAVSNTNESSASRNHSVERYATGGNMSMQKNTSSSIKSTNTAERLTRGRSETHDFLQCRTKTSAGLFSSGQRQGETCNDGTSSELKPDARRVQTKKTVLKEAHVAFTVDGRVHLLRPAQYKTTTETEEMKSPSLVRPSRPHYKDTGENACVVSKHGHTREASLLATENDNDHRLNESGVKQSYRRKVGLGQCSSIETQEPVKMHSVKIQPAGSTSPYLFHNEKYYDPTDGKVRISVEKESQINHLCTSSRKAQPQDSSSMTRKSRLSVKTACNAPETVAKSGRYKTTQETASVAERGRYKTTQETASVAERGRYKTTQETASVAERGEYKTTQETASVAERGKYKTTQETASVAERERYKMTQETASVAERGKYKTTQETASVAERGKYKTTQETASVAERERYKTTQETASVAERGKYKTTQETASVAERERYKTTQETASVAERRKYKTTQETASVAERERYKTTQETASVAERERYKTTQETTFVTERAKYKMTQETASVAEGERYKMTQETRSAKQDTLEKMRVNKTRYLSLAQRNLTKVEILQNQTPGESRGHYVDLDFKIPSPKKVSPTPSFSENSLQHFPERRRASPKRGCRQRTHAARIRACSSDTRANLSTSIVRRKYKHSSRPALTPVSPTKKPTSVETSGDCSGQPVSRSAHSPPRNEPQSSSAGNHEPAVVPSVSCHLSQMSLISDGVLSVGSSSEKNKQRNASAGVAFQDSKHASPRSTVISTKGEKGKVSPKIEVQLPSFNSSSNVRVHPKENLGLSVTSNENSNKERKQRHQSAPTIMEDDIFPACALRGKKRDSQGNPKLVCNACNSGAFRQTLETNRMLPGDEHDSAQIPYHSRCGKCNTRRAYPGEVHPTASKTSQPHSYQVDAVLSPSIHAPPARGRTPRRTTIVRKDGTTITVEGMKVVNDGSKHFRRNMTATSIGGHQLKLKAELEPSTSSHSDELEPSRDTAGAGGVDKAPALDKCASSSITTFTECDHCGQAGLTATTSFTNLHKVKRLNASEENIVGRIAHARVLLTSQEKLLLLNQKVQEILRRTLVVIKDNMCKEEGYWQESKRRKEIKKMRQRRLIEEYQRSAQNALLGALQNLDDELNAGEDESMCSLVTATCECTTMPKKCVSLTSQIQVNYDARRQDPAPPRGTCATEAVRVGQRISKSLSAPRRFYRGKFELSRPLTQCSACSDSEDTFYSTSIYSWSPHWRQNRGGHCSPSLHEASREHFSKGHPLKRNSCRLQGEGNPWCRHSSRGHGNAHISSLTRKKEAEKVHRHLSLNSRRETVSLNSKVRARCKGQPKVLNCNMEQADSISYARTWLPLSSESSSRQSLNINHNQPCPANALLQTHDSFFSDLKHLAKKIAKDGVKNSQRYLSCYECREKNSDSRYLLTLADLSRIAAAVSMTAARKGITSHWKCLSSSLLRSPSDYDSKVPSIKNTVSCCQNSSAKCGHTKRRRPTRQSSCWRAETIKGTTAPCVPPTFCGRDEFAAGGSASTTATSCTAQYSAICEHSSCTRSSFTSVRTVHHTFSYNPVFPRVKSNSLSVSILNSQTVPGQHCQHDAWPGQHSEARPYSCKPLCGCGPLPGLVSSILGVEAREHLAQYESELTSVETSASRTCKCWLAGHSGSKAKGGCARQGSQGSPVGARVVRDVTCGRLGPSVEQEEIRRHHPAQTKNWNVCGHVLADKDLQGSREKASKHGHSASHVDAKHKVQQESLSAFRKRLAAMVEENMAGGRCSDHTATSTDNMSYGQMLLANANVLERIRGSTAFSEAELQGLYKDAVYQHYLQRR